MELLRLKCPVCHSADIQYHSPYTTKNHGGRVIYKCDTCPVYFSETKNTLLEGLKTPVSVIWHVVKARTEGMGFNATARTFDKAKNRPCTCTLRINIAGSPVDRYRDKKVYTRGLVWYPSGPFTLVTPSKPAVWAHIACAGPLPVLLPTTTCNDLITSANVLDYIARFNSN